MSFQIFFPDMVLLTLLVSMTNKIKRSECISARLRQSARTISVVVDLASLTFTNQNPFINHTCMACGNAMHHALPRYFPTSKYTFYYTQRNAWSVSTATHKHKCSYYIYCMSSCKCAYSFHETFEESLQKKKVVNCFNQLCMSTQSYNEQLCLFSKVTGRSDAF